MFVVVLATFLPSFVVETLYARALREFEGSRVLTIYTSYKSLYSEQTLTFIMVVFQTEIEMGSCVTYIIA